MFSSELKRKISDKIQKILQETNDPELPKSEISFMLHVDGAEAWSWANITNNQRKDKQAPTSQRRNNL